MGAMAYSLAVEMPIWSNNTESPLKHDYLTHIDYEKSLDVLLLLRKKWMNQRDLQQL